MGNPEVYQLPRNFWYYLWELRKELGVYLGIRLISVLIIIPVPLIAKHIVDVEITAGRLEGVLWWTLAGLGLLGLHVGMVRYSISILAQNVQDIQRQLRARIFQKLQFMHFGFFDRTKGGRMLSKYAFDTQNMEATLIGLISQIIPEILKGLGLMVALAWADWRLLLFVVVTLPMLALVRYIYFERVDNEARRVRRAREKMTGQASEFISAIKLVRSFGEEKQTRETMDSFSDEFSYTRKSQMIVNQSLGNTTTGIVQGINILAVGFGGVFAIYGDLTVGSVVALVGALPVILQPVVQLSQFALQFIQGQEAFRSIKELVNSGYVESWKGSRTLPDLRGEIEFRNVTFSYSDDAFPAFRNFSLHIRSGERVAFVGPSGSGKSTIVSLLLGLYAPQEGEILIDAVPQREMAMRRFRRQCAIVMQDNLLFSGTIIENIRFGNPAATRKQAEMAAEQANCLGFINELPHGFEEKVGERGSTLSGGQRQRIAIARALLRDPSILILDEATSALDYESERLVQEALERLARNRTTITIAHRLSTIRNADRIVVLEQGKIIQEGSWDDLAREKDGPFAAQLHSQEEV